MDLEGVLISNAVSQIPRKGLYDFLVSCDQLFRQENIVIFTTVTELRFREIGKQLVAQHDAPEWFATMRYICWQGDVKDLRFVCSDPDSVILLDDCEEYVIPEQKYNWIDVDQFSTPYDDDTVLNQVLLELQARLAEDKKLKK